MAVDLFGWDLIYRSVENDLNKKEDLLVAFTHWFIIKNGLLCIGNGESKTLTGDEVKGETLSQGWNQNEDYNIRYMYGDRLYLLRASVTGGDIIFNFLRADDLCISSCVFKVEETVKQLKGDINVTIPDYKNLLTVLRNELIDPVFFKITHTAVATQTTEKIKPASVMTRQDPYSPEQTVDPLQVPPPRRTRPIPRIDPLWNDPLHNPPAVGRDDLDPLAGIGGGLGRGGMLFDPLNPRNNRRSIDPVPPGPSIPSGLPRGAVPPGARFDPISPPGFARGGARRGDPDPDHLPPPGYDDMFMNDTHTPGGINDSLNPIGTNNRQRREPEPDSEPDPDSDPQP